MKLCVYGLWHLGSVTAACMAQHFPTVGLDLDLTVTEGLREGRAPIFEPSLNELIQMGLSWRELEITSDLASVATADIVWVTFDTPVDESDQADVESVVTNVKKVFPHLADNAVVLISSQVPVGTTARLETAFAEVSGGRHVEFAYTPENLRLGRAIYAFCQADRIVVGTRTSEGRRRVGQLLAPLGPPILWMSVESAEMTKHAVNAFLATSVVFINEIATACEATGADAKEVERGLKSEGRIGPGAYLGPGAAFSGGTLSRDVSFLVGMGEEFDFLTPLFSGVKKSNDAHRGWFRRRLTWTLGDFSEKTIAVLGLTYKPNTDTLRGSESVSLSRFCLVQGASVRAYDPSIRDRSVELPLGLTLSKTVEDAIRGADAIVVATDWPVFLELTADTIASLAPGAVVLDANRFLAEQLSKDSRIRYLAVGLGDKRK